MKKTIFLTSLVVALVGCQQVPTEQKQDVAVTPYAGTYEGVLPAADCPGIQTTLFLKAQGTYSMTMSYLERNTTFEEAGNWDVKDGKLTLSSMRRPGQKRFWRFRSDGKLCKLDADQNRITGALAEHYCLRPLQ